MSNVVIAGVGTVPSTEPGKTEQYRVRREKPPRAALADAGLDEFVTRLRGRAGARQVDGARVAQRHHLALGGACVITRYEEADA